MLPPQKDPNFTPEINRLVNEILESEPNNINALFFRGLKAFKTGEDKIAIDNWTTLLSQLPPKSQMAHELSKKLESIKK